MARKGRGYDPLVVRLVQHLVDERVMETTVDSVDEEVGEGNEERELEDITLEARVPIGGVLQHAISADLGDEDMRREQS